MKNDYPPQIKKGFGVAASPLNRVKLELGITLILGLLLWLAADSITASIASQLLLLLGYGFIGACWLIYRTRRVLQQWDGNNLDDKSDSDQPNGPVS